MTLSDKYKKDGKFSLVLDSSQVALFLACPQKWYNQYYKGLEPITFVEPEDEPMDMGTYGHKLMDIFYRARFRGLSLNDAFQACLDYNPDTDNCECGCTREFHERVDLLKTDVCKRCQKCLSWRPKSFPLSRDVRYQIVNRMRDYIFHYQANDFKPLSEQHVEVGFSEPIYEDAENLFVLEGRIDMIGTLQGLECVIDHKFQLKSHWLYPKSIQFKNYCLVTKKNMMIINYVRLHKNFQPQETLARDIITFNPIELAVWKKRLICIYFDMKQALLSGKLDRHWNACSGYSLTYKKAAPRYCWYTTLCEEIDPKIEQVKEKQLFKIKEVEWKPW